MKGLKLGKNSSPTSNNKEKIEKMPGVNQNDKESEAIESDAIIIGSKLEVKSYLQTLNEKIWKKKNNRSDSRDQLLIESEIKRDTIHAKNN